MIHLKKQNIIFLKPRKVAGTSFEIALSQFATTGDIITPIGSTGEIYRQSLGFRKCQNYRKSIPEFRLLDVYRLLSSGKMPMKFDNHISAKKSTETTWPS